MEFLESPCIKEKATVAELAKLLDDVMPNNDAKLNLMAEIITELREPLQADNSEPDLDLLIQENDRKVCINLIFPSLVLGNVYGNKNELL